MSTVRPEPRATFASRFGTVATMIGVAIGLGNFWRFPYLVGRFGGAAFVLFYVLAVVAIGVPGLMAEWALGRHTRRGPVGAYERAGVRGGRALGWFFFIVVIAATAYYSVAVGWVLAFGLAQLGQLGGLHWNAAAVLPPQTGFSTRAFGLQLACTAAVVLTGALVLRRGVRRGIEATSRLLMPALLVILIIVIVRALTLPGARAGVHWYLLKFRPGSVTPTVMLAALGQAVFSLGLGGTFMVVYGSYLSADEGVRGSAAWTAGADTAAGLLAGLAIFPAVFAFGLQPASGPGLIFTTLPRVFAAMPGGALFGALLFAALFTGALLSDIAALEVLVAGLTDNTRLSRGRAIALAVAAVLLCALPPMVNLHIFVRWDLTFGSGMQTLGALLAVLTVGWAMDRATSLRALAGEDADFPAWLYYWIRYVVPAAILAIGVWWLLTDVAHAVRGV